MIATEKRLYTPEEYLTRERQALDKSEYFAGEIIPMAGATRNHNRIRDNVNGKVINHLEEGPCQSFSSDMRVHLPETGLYAYPDLVIVCGEPALLPGEFDNLLNPTVLIEIMSDSTEDYDRGRKFFRYRAIPTVQEYVLIDAQTIEVEVWSRNELGKWTLAEQITDPAGQFTIQSIDLTITLQHTYARTVGLLA
ncbi:Uma2 family endonuclease [Spirosoma rhododendri]|uniref:Uma2 family endonuclease n=1 Tax=Spirosoma rhododendri TaxID=2728024 RepID=A0A7L5DMY6_9BACT|nr:Uma2 family endonuclease [Spirosoma rhododendri]QJD78902.1 Uma2 family endonuclease [Spirosoma rhododendri]